MFRVHRLINIRWNLQPYQHVSSPFQLFLNNSGLYVYRVSLDFRLMHLVVCVMLRATEEGTYKGRNILTNLFQACHNCYILKWFCSEVVVGDNVTKQLSLVKVSLVLT